MVGNDQRSYQPGFVCCGRMAASDYYSNTKRGNQYKKPRRETRHRRPALEKQPITESPTMMSCESDRQTATKLGVNRMTLTAWLGGRDRPQRCMLARLAGFFETRWLSVGCGWKPRLALA